ncbi:hypothetical protein OQA88_2307 [Cercophora sp. LCS_1]
MASQGSDSPLSSLTTISSITSWTCKREDDEVVGTTPHADAVKKSPSPKKESPSPMKEDVVEAVSAWLANSVEGAEEPKSDKIPKSEDTDDHATDLKPEVLALSIEDGDVEMADAAPNIKVEIEAESSSPAKETFLPADNDTGASTNPSVKKKPLPNKPITATTAGVTEAQTATEKVAFDLGKQPAPPAPPRPEASSAHTIPTASASTDKTNTLKRPRDESAFEPVPPTPVDKPKALIFSNEAIIDGRQALMHTIRRVCTIMGHTVPPDFDAMSFLAVHPGVDRVYEHLSGGKITTKEQMDKYWNLHKQIAASESGGKIALFPGVVQLLLAAKKNGVPRLILCNNYDACMKVMESMKILRLFNGYIDDRGASAANWEDWSKKNILPWYTRKIDKTGNLQPKDVIWCYSTMVEFPGIKRSGARGCWVNLFNLPLTAENTNTELIVQSLPELKKALFEDHVWQGKDNARANVNDVDEKDIVYLRDETPEALRELNKSLGNQSLRKSAKSTREEDL